jgi:signal transduction histidine kinase/ActR/RegA family two-component response regulator
VSRLFDFRLRRSVRGRLLIAAIVVEAVMLTLLVSNSVRLQRTHMTEQAERHAQQIVPILNAALVAPMAQSDYATTQAVLDESRSGQGIAYLILRDSGGHLVAHSGWSRDQPMPQADERFDLSVEDDPPIYDLVTPVALAGQPLGQLHFGLDMSALGSANRQLLLQGAGIAAGELLLSIALLTGLGLWLTHQLFRLTRAAEEVAHGNLTPAPVAEGEDEVGQLGRAFNAMSATIRERIGELQSLHEKEHGLARIASEANGRLEALLDAMDIGVLLADHDDKVLYANDKLAQVWALDVGRPPDGCPLQAVESMCVAQLTPGTALPVFAPDGSEREILLADGRTLTQRGFAVRDGDGREVGRMWLSEDVSAARAAADELRRARDQAEAASRAKAAFLATMSHEIRTPMNGIIGMTDMVLSEPLSAEQRENLGWVKSSADSLMGILNDILDYSKVDAGRLQLEAVDFSIAALVAETLAIFSTQAAGKGIELRWQIASALPALVNGDPLRLRQILSNLVSNALKFTAQGGVTVSVEEAGEGRIALSVTDTGIGIPPDKQALVFMPFLQADSSTTRNFGGTGLGLSIVSRLVELMRGTITLDSAPGRGSTFRVVLPLPAAQTAAAAAQPDTVAATCEDALRNAEVLIAEDTPVNQVLLGRLLSRYGVRITEAADGRQAVAACGERHFDLVLMDMQMPVMDGLEATRRIRALEDPHWRQVPIVAITANALDEDRGRCRDAGMDDFISKPFQAGELVATLARRLSDRRTPDAG